MWKSSRGKTGLKNERERETGYHFFFLCALLIWFVLSVPYVLIGKELLFLNSYDALYELLETPLLQTSYLSRIVLDIISFAQMDASRILYVLLREVHVVELAGIAALIIAVPVVEHKKETTASLLLLLFEAVVSIGCIWKGLNSASLQEAIVYIRIIGGVMAGVHFLLCCLLLYHAKRRMSYLRKELQRTKKASLTNE